MTGFSELAHSFGAIADLYDRVRPGYPLDATKSLLGGATGTVADIGAGTGKFTRVLTEIADNVVAVEPDPGMRTQLAAQLSTVTILAGTGEAIPLPDNSVDAVTFAQSWHWVDPAAASAEAARVLRPGGVLGLIWNEKDSRVPWVAALDDLSARPERNGIVPVIPGVTAPFGPEERHTTDRWVQELDRSDIVALVASRSYVSTLPEDERAAMLARVERLLATHPDTAHLDTIGFPYVTTTIRYVLPH